MPMQAQELLALFDAHKGLRMKVFGAARAINVPNIQALVADNAGLANGFVETAPKATEEQVQVASSKLGEQWPLIEKAFEKADAKAGGKKTTPKSPSAAPGNPAASANKPASSKPAESTASASTADSKPEGSDVRLAKIEAALGRIEAALTQLFTSAKTVEGGLEIVDERLQILNVTTADTRQATFVVAGMITGLDAPGILETPVDGLEDIPSVETEGSDEGEGDDSGGNE